MADVALRNIDIADGTPVRDWPYEAIVTIIERGYISDWQLLYREIKASPWGRVATMVTDYAEYGEVQDVAQLLLSSVKRSRETHIAEEKTEVAARVRAALDNSGRSAGEFAAECGTSASRLSTYRTGKVLPSAGMLIRMERVSRQLAGRVPA